MLKTDIGVEKVTELVLVSAVQGRYKQTNRREFLMLCVIAILGGSWSMMGQHTRSESLFYYFRIEDRVPEDHCCASSMARSVSTSSTISCAVLSDTGRSSIDPEVLLRILLLGYLYGITSERKLVEELRMHLAWRWFTGLASTRKHPLTRRFPRTGHAIVIEET